MESPVYEDKKAVGTLGQGSTGSADSQLEEDEDALKLDCADDCPDPEYIKMD